MCRDGQESDDRDNLFPEKRQKRGDGTIQYAGSIGRKKRVGQPTICFTWEASTTNELISDTSSFRALLFRPYPKKTRMRPAMESLC